MDVVTHLFRKVFEYAGWVGRKAKPFRSQIILLLICRSASGVALVLVALASREMVDSGIRGDMRRALQYGLYFAVLVAIHILLDLYGEIASGRTSEKFAQTLREEQFALLADARWLASASVHSGDWMTRLTMNVTAISSSVVQVLPEVVALAVQFVAAFTTLLVLEPRLALLAFLVGPVALLLSRWWGVRLGEIQEKSQECDSAWRSYLQDAIRNLMVLKAFTAVPGARRRLAQLHGERYAWMVKETRTMAWMTAAIGSGYWLGYLLAFGWGVARVSAGAATFGTLTAFLQLVEQVQGPFVALSGMIPQLIYLGTSVKRLRAIERLPAEQGSAPEDGRVDAGSKDGQWGAGPEDGRVDAGPEDGRVDAGSEDGQVDAGPEDGRVDAGSVAWGVASSGSCALADKPDGATRHDPSALHRDCVFLMRHVSFAYVPEHPVIRHVSMHLRTGEIVGLVGPSGEGKTTLIRLMLALVTQDAGQVLLGEGCLLPATASTRTLVSYVPQGHTLFSGTLAENLRLGNSEATEGEMIEALRAADAWEFVGTLEQGLATRIGEEALGLSEGQAQRIGLARAFLRKAPILVLDEATSSLDRKTEARVLEQIRGMHRRPACLVVTHRSSALSICDRVYRLEKGMLTEVPACEEA